MCVFFGFILTMDFNILAFSGKKWTDLFDYSFKKLKKDKIPSKSDRKHMLMHSLFRSQEYAIPHTHTLIRNQRNDLHSFVVLKIFLHFYSQTYP